MCRARRECACGHRRLRSPRGAYAGLTDSYMRNYILEGLIHMRSYMRQDLNIDN